VGKGWRGRKKLLKSRVKKKTKYKVIAPEKSIKPGR